MHISTTGGTSTERARHSVVRSIPKMCFRICGLQMVLVVGSGVSVNIALISYPAPSACLRALTWMTMMIVVTTAIAPKPKKTRL
jgi:hypothetical protein